VSNASGKLVIIGILTVALASAGISWWFRYSATHRAVRFWGSNAAQLIRDAPTVELYEAARLPDSAYKEGLSKSYLDVADGRDISHAPGLVHLRNALLEDQSFDWPPNNDYRPTNWGWILVFRGTEPNEVAALFFTRDWLYTDSLDHDEMLSTEPIASGLEKFVDELRSRPETSSR